MKKSFTTLGAIILSAAPAFADSSDIRVLNVIEPGKIVDAALKKHIDAGAEYPDKGVIISAHSAGDSEIICFTDYDISEEAVSKFMDGQTGAVYARTACQPRHF